MGIKKGDSEIKKLDYTFKNVIPKSGVGRPPKELNKKRKLLTFSIRGEVFDLMEKKEFRAIINNFLKSFYKENIK
jgi:hypothetical protein